MERSGFPMRNGITALFGLALDSDCRRSLTAQPEEYRRGGQCRVSDDSTCGMSAAKPGTLHSQYSAIARGGH